MSRFGQFSHLWIDMAQRLGYEVKVLDVEWPKGVPVELYEQELRADKEHRIKGGACLSQRDRHGSQPATSRRYAWLDAANIRRCSTSIR